VNHHFALTEYAANPTTPERNDEAEAAVTASVPPEFLLPNGMPDVSVLVGIGFTD
jgi:hypothetical protein